MESDIDVLGKYSGYEAMSVICFTLCRSWPPFIIFLGLLGANLSWRVEIAPIDPEQVSLY